MWLSKEIVSRVVRLSDPIPLDAWPQLGGDLFKGGRLDGVYVNISYDYIDIISV